MAFTVLDVSTSGRVGRDACPGALTTHDAADGALARVRLPGGAVTAHQLAALAGCAEDLGDGTLHLTSRANVQLRGLPRGGGDVAARLSAAGLLPAPAHERVRNIIASPASGLAGGRADVRAMVGELDRALCALPELSTLPGRFLLGLDDGRGDLARQGTDVCWQAVTRYDGALLLAGADTGLRIDAADAVPALITCARAFLAARGDRAREVWRVAELPGAAEPLRAQVRARHAVRARPPADLPEGQPILPGTHPQDDGRAMICCAPPLGTLPAGLVRRLAALASAMVLTPWRTVLLPDLTADRAAELAAELAGEGLATGDEPGSGVSACTGLPGCGRSLADVRADAVRVLPHVPAGTRAHFAGCARRCGRPGDAHIDVLADEHGYLVNGAMVPAESLADSLREKGKL